VNYAILVDGERVTRVDTADDVSDWLVKYREEHEDDDPGAAHVQIIERGSMAWLTGGKLLDRRTFFRPTRPT
jgi:hypothetical protein